MRRERVAYPGVRPSNVGRAVKSVITVEDNVVVIEEVSNHYD